MGAMAGRTPINMQFNHSGYEGEPGNETSKYLEEEKETSILWHERKKRMKP